MYQFTNTVVINSALDSNGTTAKFSGTSSAFTVTRVNTFLKDNIVGVYKRAYSAPVNEVATFVVPAATSGDVLTFKILLTLTTRSLDTSFANVYLQGQKPILVSIISSGVANTDAAALNKAINKIKTRYGAGYITSTVSSATLTLTASNEMQRFKSIELFKDGASENSMFQPSYVSLYSTFTVTTPGNEGFGNEAYMISSVRIPTATNQAYFGINAEERPIPGGNYYQYTIRYKIAKDDDGISAGGYSITNHVFYVTSALQASFETALANTYGSLTTIGGDIDFIIIGDETLANSTTSVYTAANYLTTAGTPETINWSISALTGTSIAANSPSTSATLTTGTTDGTTTITATGATSGRTATFVVTVA